MAASRRGLGRSKGVSHPTACSSAPAIDEAGAARSGTEALLLSRQAQRVDQLVELSVHHLGEVMRREADAMVGDAVLREVRGADLLLPIARADSSAPHRRPRRLLLGANPVEPPRPQ